MKFAVLLTSVLCVLLLAFQADALVITGVEFYPENPSIGSGFIVVARVESNSSVRVPWMVPGACGVDGTCYGQMPKSGDAYICYFSNIDLNASCGPSPFSIPGSLERFVVFAMDGTGAVVQQETEIATGAVQFNAYLQIYNESIKMQVFQQFDSVSYKVYDKSMIEKASGNLSRNEYGTYIGDIAYQEEYKFIVFSGSGASGLAGAVMTVPSPQADEPEIPGSNATYNVKAQDVTVYDGVVRQGKTFRYTGSRITNNGATNVTELRVVVPDALKKYLRVTLNNSTLAPNESIPMIVEVVNLEGHLEISTTVDVMAGETKVGMANINIKISVLAGEGGAADNPPTVTPAIVKGDYLLEETKETISIRNNHDSEIMIYNYSSPEIGSILSMSLPETAIPPGGSVQVEMTLSPSSSGERMGIVTLETDAGRAYVFVDAIFHTNISDRISLARSSLDSALAGLSESQKNSLSDVTDDIESDLSSAQSSFDMGSYEAADRKIDDALAKVSLVQRVSGVISGSGGYTPATCDCDELFNSCDEGCDCDPDCGSSGGFDFTFVIIIVVVALGAFGAWYYFTKIRKTGWEGEVEDDF
ncbi:MAG: hypothetical protein ABIH90_00605 [Candidatus Aenigmatarchaeota archaeon]